MKNKEFKLLVENWKSYLNESFNPTTLENLVKDLNKHIEERINSGYSFTWLPDLFYYERKSYNLKKLGSGVERTAYSIPNEDWVLKISNDENAVDTNQFEIEVSKGAHGKGPRDIFVEVYDYDKISEKPLWLICQKVITLEDSVGKVELSKIFPTITNMLDDKVSDYQLSRKIPELLFEFSYRESDGPAVTKKKFYDQVESYFYVKPFEEVEFYEDYNAIAKIFAYTKLDDIHAGNIGIVNSSNPSPKDIKILDYTIREEDSDDVKSRKKAERDLKDIEKVKDPKYVKPENQTWYEFYEDKEKEYLESWKDFSSKNVRK